MALITVQHLTKKYAQHTVVSNLSFELQPRSCIALLGQNGAGKTTTLKMLSGLIKPDRRKHSVSTALFPCT